MSRKLVSAIPVTLLGLAALVTRVTPVDAQIVGGSNIITNADVTTLRLSRRRPAPTHQHLQPCQWGRQTGN